MPFLTTWSFPSFRTLKQTSEFDKLECTVRDTNADMAKTTLSPIESLHYPGITRHPLIRKPLQFLLRLVPGPRRVIILSGRLRGKYWIAGSSISSCWVGTYEYEKQSAFAAAIRPGDTVYDLGANVGFFSLLAAVRVGDRGRVFSFEPAPRNLQFLRRHLDLNHMSQCTVIPAAVSRVSGTALFHFDDDKSQSAGYIANNESTGSPVRAVNIDSLIEAGEILPPNVIKCDIEGAEHDALLGALSTLKKYRPAIFLATHGQEVHDRCCELLSGLGYSVDSLNGSALVSSREIVARFD